jgi:hypothetical protein
MLNHIECPLLKWRKVCIGSCCLCLQLILHSVPDTAVAVGPASLLVALDCWGLVLGNVLCLFMSVDALKGQCVSWPFDA